MSDRKVRIALSRDGAYNFGDWRTRDLGALGQYRHRGICTMLGDGEADFSSFYETPDFIVRRDEAMQGRDRTAAARGRLNSGGHEADVMRLSADLGAQGYGGYLNTLFNLAGHGSNATNTVTSAGGQFGANTGSYLQNMGNARASGYAAAGQARSDALNGVGSAFGDLWGQSQQNRNNPGWT